ncbi:iron-sulfur cluster repair di-iron protein [Alicyclobacillaceae bacterium I2511]|nr:iron-sulfur cluster repair di-iron protein [Alicyclobacillaceae bacterium I2511]
MKELGKVFEQTHQLGEVVVQFPGAGEVFQRHGLDYCCRGNRSIAVAAQQAGVDAEGVLAELNAAYRIAENGVHTDHDWQKERLQALMDYVVHTHHAYLHKTMAPLGELVTKILRVHGAHHGETLRQVHQLYNQFKMNMEEHLIKEEEVDFPMIARYEIQPDANSLQAVLNLIQGLEAEHQEVGDLLREIRRVTEDFTLPADACATFSYTYDKLQELESDTFRHIHLENNLLFPRLAASVA